MVKKISHSPAYQEYIELMKKVHMPSAKPSKKDILRLDELAYIIIPEERKKLMEENSIFVFDEKIKRREKSMTQEIKERLKQLRAENKQLIVDRRETVAKLKEFVQKGKDLREEMKTLQAKLKASE